MEVGQRVRLTHPQPGLHFTERTGTVSARCDDGCEGFWFIHMDEPWSYLDASGQEHIHTVIKEIEVNMEAMATPSELGGES